ncbi:G-type lectin S-receptor-like serine/threonine-protein kinase At1g11330 isoform X3 [Salvia miltiorrhiza]|uniref:G-type lectin S-receptor-like serine/threonine-protein kinase At1g11330 isoform X2 n=1 Tax=Salvia miltiorrhiza TaxID=226208 RepID=UPI0025AD35C8|nr:G-type lectin S-receptor-like serine/threonine-protein kinase At1g11330 isoform X2 [Salvia miltiorrhiza]XP_057796275.1 G-type lectin S-receptor-like serine/threonine-protein kinase At1g11330 isoform X2 [Salvia miltiorrhiza]XP_057796276.1 G-type lectin S-receptor-like serine/threonine-protein kinase At1g11330 isoform X2 [Salvia miltiorrhiza]XP_057796277.1 G-type lectin S-receptor-like serine/threonine-protein kinase At1g11330 isoform X3 [Salvia miltiorrhiza]
MGFNLQKRLRYYVLQLLFLIFYCFLTFSSAIDLIKANESLRNSDALISKGNTFKLSFFSPPNSSRRYVGIMYNLPVMSVVWVANRDKPLNDSSGTFQISSDGNLVILDGRKEIVWSTNLSSSVANYSAVLLDTGNLVLQDDSNNEYVWESFQHASDSFLPKMRLFVDANRKEKNILTSWTSPDDPAPGRFTMIIEPDIPQSYVLEDGTKPCFRSGPWNGQRFIGLPGMRSLYNDGTNVGSDSPGTAFYVFTVPNSSVLLYFVLSSSGIIEEREWSDEKKGWDVTWRTDNECDIYGKCGSFGSCDARESPICTCFRGFVPTREDEWEAGNWTSGCTRKSPLKCEQNNSLGKEDEFLKMGGVKLPDHYVLFPVDGDCRGACLSNCSCIAYADASGIGCMHWTHNLTDNQKFASGGEDLYVRLAYSELHEKQDRRAIIATTVVLGFILIAVCTYFLPKILSKYRARKHENKLISPQTKENGKHGVELEELPIVRFEMLSDATGKFDPANMLGEGGFGPVFKGQLPNGQEIAVKRLARSSNQGVEEFTNEVVVISQLQHRNLVRLIGCCVENEEKMLVYEYMPNGSLDACLFGSHKREFLNWQTRKLIIEGICRGLLYLHRDSRLKIIHRDLKASNILLDEELNPKISDFGMARIFGGKDDQANTSRVVGTFGYMSPEYAHRGIFSEKSDVYSFGVLLIEIVSGKKNSSFYDEDQQLFLTAYAWKLWNEGRIVKLIDPAIYDSGMEDDVVRYANVGLLCVQEMAADRPNVSTVLSMLSCEIVELPHPKQPAFLGMQSFQSTESSTKSSTKCSVNDVTISILGGR